MHLYRPLFRPTLVRTGGPGNPPFLAPPFVKTQNSQQLTSWRSSGTLIDKYESYTLADRRRMLFDFTWRSE
jgi:hypothetical protein